MEYKEGFYHITSEAEPKPVLVHGYKCTDMGGAFVFGFNTHDGGGLLPLSDVTDGTKITAVRIGDDRAIEAIGWAYADCCVTLDKGGDPRQTVMPDVLVRATKDLGL
ncbi:MAG: hypothetical protein COA47_10195 [Robiginitomaculum sp.]|nr:MAG: hypothetical protein COA47_10195 [Robiginitomaculum sp.]